MRMTLLRRSPALLALLAMWFLVGFTSAPAQMDSVHDDGEDDEYDCFDVCEDIENDCMESNTQIFNDCNAYNKEWDSVAINCTQFNTNVTGGIVDDTAASHCADLFEICNDNCAECGFVIC